MIIYIYIYVTFRRTISYVYNHHHTSSTPPDQHHHHPPKNHNTAPLLKMKPSTIIALAITTITSGASA
jgi:hypothetical protein